MWTGDHRTEDQAGTEHEAIQQPTGRTDRLGWFFYIPTSGQEIIEQRTRLALSMRPFNRLQVGLRGLNLLYTVYTGGHWTVDHRTKDQADFGGIRPF